MITLVNALSNVIYGLYPTKDIYIEKVEQSFTPGTFFIEPMISTDDSGMANRRYRSYTYDVMYYPVSDTEPKAEALAVGEALREAFELIQYDGRYIKSESRDITIVDDVLHIELTFKVIVDAVVSETAMDSMEATVTRE